jgi:hypothetical protein
MKIHAIAAMALLAALFLPGCAQPARMDQMTAIPSVELPVTSGLRHAVQVNDVTGGSSTSPLWVSKVGNTEFQAALQTSLRGAGLLADGPGRYHLDTVLVSLEQPLLGFDLSVKSTVHYVLTDSSGKSLFDSPVTAEFTATVGDAFAAVERLRIANEGSIKKNIQMFMDQLITTMGQQPAISEVTVKGAPAGG